MSVSERRVRVTDLQVGMYVSQLDRPWDGTPFPLQGFRIDTPDEIASLARLCREVTIDTELGRAPVERTALQKLGDGDARSSGQMLDHEHYPLVNDMASELPLAAAAMEEVRLQAARVLERLASGVTVHPEELQAAVSPVVASVIRNPDAWFWLAALRRHDNYAYEHAINVCALVTVFGRHLGLPRDRLQRLALAGMLQDVGMTALPNDLLQQRAPLSQAQRSRVVGHVEASLDLLGRQASIGDDVLEMIAHHHERHDGSGYPQGLRGNAIPLLARMLGLVDSYHAMCSERPWRAGSSAHDALQALYRESDRLFQAELVEQFSQCLGVYPTGSMVELTSGEVAVVTAQNPARRLFPRVTVLTHANKQLDPAFRQADLWAERRQVDGQDQRVWVARAL
ncbi:MAG: HD-GYP domain-containing protein, partial [Xanthomonadales bacterium]|nr:HD-GYP domain-containing protein [Xanthomonadales bacterium]